MVGGRVDAILRGSKFIELKKAIQFGREGGFAQANKDFDALLNGAKQVTRDGGLRTATLEDGTKINVRPYSSGDKPTLEIDTPYDDVPTIKIRY